VKAERRAFILVTAPLCAGFRAKPQFAVQGEWTDSHLDKGRSRYLLTVQGDQSTTRNTSATLSSIASNLGEAQIATARNKAASGASGFVHPERFRPQRTQVA